MNDEKKIAFRFLIRLRRECRNRCAHADRLREALRHAERRATVIKAQDGFVYSGYLYDIEEAIRSLEKPLGEIVEGLLALGHMLVEVAPLIDRVLTLDEKCDALNVNRIDRVGLKSDLGIIHLCFAHALEDSAERRKQDVKDSPTFNALQRVFAEFLDTPAGLESAAEAMGEILGRKDDGDEDWRSGPFPVPKMPLLTH